MKFYSIACGIIIVLFFISCSENKGTDMQQEQHINEELKKINSLLQDTSFALEMAKSQEAAYYKSLGATVPPFLPGNNDTSMIKGTVKEEKIAMNIAGFYALECAIGALMEQKGGTPIGWLNKINEKKLDSTEILVFNRFANATWKAGQPFRGVNRVTRDVFISAVFLPEDEIKKDFCQVSAAAAKLLPALQEITDSSKVSQLKKISLLLKDKQFAMEMAQHIESTCHTAPQQPVPGEDTATIKKPVKEEKIAINIAGFYALECGLSYLATSKKKLPSAVLQSIINDSIDKEDKRMFERFANATWKAGQPFRRLDRITRDNFTCFDLLSPEEVEKDWVQVKAAAGKLKESL